LEKVTAAFQGEGQTLFGLLVRDREIWRFFIAITRVDDLSDAYSNRQLRSVGKPYQDLSPEIWVFDNEELSD